MKSERISPFWVGGYHPFSACAPSSTESSPRRVCPTGHIHRIRLLPRLLGIWQRTEARPPFPASPHGNGRVPGARLSLERAATTSTTTCYRIFTNEEYRCGYKCYVFIQFTSSNFHFSFSAILSSSPSLFLPK